MMPAMFVTTPGELLVPWWLHHTFCMNNLSSSPQLFYVSGPSYFIDKGFWTTVIFLVPHGECSTDNWTWSDSEAHAFGLASGDQALHKQMLWAAL